MCCVHVHIPLVGCMLYLCYVCIIYVVHVLGMPCMSYVCPACVCVSACDVEYVFTARYVVTVVLRALMFMSMQMEEVEERERKGRLTIINACACCDLLRWWSPSTSLQPLTLQLLFV